MVFPLRAEEGLKQYTLVAKAGEEYHRKHWRLFPKVKLVEEKKTDIAEWPLWESDNGWPNDPDYLSVEDLYAEDVIVERSKGKYILKSRWCVRIYFLNGRFLVRKFDSEAAAKNWVSQVFGEFKYKLTV